MCVSRREREGGQGVYAEDKCVFVLEGEDRAVYTWHCQTDGFFFLGGGGGWDGAGRGGGGGAMPITWDAQSAYAVRSVQ